MTSEKMKFYLKTTGGFRPFPTSKSFRFSMVFYGSAAPRVSKAAAQALSHHSIALPVSSPAGHAESVSHFSTGLYSPATPYLKMLGCNTDQPKKTGHYRPVLRHGSW